jgi:hypothetical protein
VNDSLEPAINKLHGAIETMKDALAAETISDDKRKIAIAITQAETALLWLGAVRPNERG